MPDLTFEAASRTHRLNVPSSRDSRPGPRGKGDRVAAAPDVVWDVISDFDRSPSWNPSRLVNAVIAAARRQDMLADWGVREGMRVLGVESPAELLEAMCALRTDTVSPLVEQDVLLMAGRADHHVPCQSSATRSPPSPTHGRSPHACSRKPNTHKTTSRSATSVWRCA
jgi:hypothetical protein